MIIVEGPDGAGKTTLLEQLQGEFGFPIAPRAVSKETTRLVNLKDWTEDNIRAGYQLMFFDRHRLISDPVYRFAIPGKKPDYELYDKVWIAEMIENLVKDVRPFVIFCLPPLEVVRANVEADPDNSVVAGVIDMLYHSYTVHMIHWKLMLGRDVLVYDYTNDDPNDAITWLRGKIG